MNRYTSVYKESSDNYAAAIQYRTDYLNKIAFDPKINNFDKADMLWGLYDEKDIKELSPAAFAHLKKLGILGGAEWETWKKKRRRK
jgi:hypothetical protein